MIEKNILVEAFYLPPLEYFCSISNATKIILERHENMVKQSYRNRFQLLTSQGVLTLVVPLKHVSTKTPIGEIQIDYGQKWQNQHWRSIESAYHKAPFFEFYSDQLKEILYQRHGSIFDLNKSLLSFCLRSLGLKISISETVSYEKVSSDSVFDLRSQINAKTPYTSRHFYHPKPYYQVFGNTFAENMSIVDLLFCEGPQAARLLNESRN